LPIRTNILSSAPSPGKRTILLDIMPPESASETYYSAFSSPHLFSASGIGIGI
jgi:hypothetical protein